MVLNSLAYKKEDQTVTEIAQEEDCTQILQVEKYNQQLWGHYPTEAWLAITENGVSDLALHQLMQANITVKIHKVWELDQNHFARASGTGIVSLAEELGENDVGTRAGLPKIKITRQE